MSRLVAKWRMSLFPAILTKCGIYEVEYTHEPLQGF